MVNYKALNDLPDQITIADYLFHRLRQLSIETIFGLPGEFNMPLLDKLYHIPNLRWAGNANELNAAYAADGYARMKRLGCIITTFGVGELSAINGIAGSYAEHVGVIHIVGMPPTSAQTKQLLLHHTLGNGDYNVFYRMANDVACHTGLIVDSDLCADEVDKCIEFAWKEQKPSYLGIPVNQVNLPVNADRLNIPLSLTVKPNKKEPENEVLNTILKNIYNCKNPVIIIDAGTMRHGLVDEAEEFCRRTNFPVYVTPMGKGAVNETLPNFGGVFSGSLSSPEVREVVDFADFVIIIGSLLAEFSTSTFHFYYKAKNCIQIFPNSVKVKNSTYPDIHMKPLMKNLLNKLNVSNIQYFKEEHSSMVVPKHEVSNNQLLRQEWVWNELSHWFRENDIIVTEVGTSSFGINQTKFPPHTHGISQALWGSSGYSIGACLGLSFAAQELERTEDIHHRVILFVGDGAFQMTMQEVSTLIKWNLKPYIFVMNNEGYSIDRFLHHRTHKSLYDVQPWNYLNLFNVFGATDYETRKIVTLGDLKDMIYDKHFGIDDKIRMMEIMVPSTDVPQALVDRWVKEKEEYKKMNDLHELQRLENSPHIFDSPTSSDALSERSRKRSNFSSISSISRDI